MSIEKFDFSTDLSKVILWRFNNAKNLQQIIKNKQNFLDENQKEFWENWVNDVFNLDTANAFGLSLWSIILNLPISIEPQGQTDINNNFGFNEFRKNFNSGRGFSDGISPTKLLEEDARIALKLRYYQLITKGTIPELNKIINEVLGDFGSINVIDNQDMSITYAFSFTPRTSLRLIFEKFDLLPRPAGVEITNTYNTNKFFGFGSKRKNFKNSGFRHTI